VLNHPSLFPLLLGVTLLTGCASQIIGGSRNVLILSVIILLVLMIITRIGQEIQGFAPKVIFTISSFLIIIPSSYLGLFAAFESGEGGVSEFFKVWYERIMQFWYIILSSIKW